jgi:tripartite-type tricarboxylate transporter receptor subunit TctC
MVNPGVPAKTVAEFIAYAKANPGKINMSSPGIGSANHILGELFNMMAGIKMVHVPYKGSQFPDLISGQVQVTFNPLPSSLGFIKSGKLRALGVTSATRQAVLPDVPAIGETVKSYEGNAWFGIGAPKKTPKDIVDKLNSTINAGLADPVFKKKLEDLGGVPMSVTPAAFTKFTNDETEKWAKVVAFSGAKVE